MKFVSVLPVSKHNNNIYFLLGREQEYLDWEDSNKFSDFGGAIEGDENILDAGARECYEESMGFLGTQEQIRKDISPNSKKFITALKVNEGVVILYKVDYDENMEKHYINVYNYFKKCSVEIKKKFRLPKCPKGFYEKNKIQWFPYSKLKRLKDNSKLFRKDFLMTLDKIFNLYNVEENLNI